MDASMERFSTFANGKRLAAHGYDSTEVASPRAIAVSERSHHREIEFVTISPSSLAAPLVELGPGGDYRRRYVASGTRILRHPEDATMRRDSRVASAPPAQRSVSGLFRRAANRLYQRFESLACEIFSTSDAAPFSNTDLASALASTTDHESPLQDAPRHESHSEAAPRPSAHPSLAQVAGVLPDDAGTGDGARRQQGHGLRARRGAGRQGRAQARPEQGTLFVGVG
jgi:hypothetical protein